MNIKIIRTLVRKEMLDVFRDKKTVVIMLFIPVILYPLIFLGGMQVIALISSNMEEQNYRIVVDAADDGAFARMLAKRENGTETSDGREASGEQADGVEISDDQTEGVEISGGQAEEERYTITLVEAGGIGD